ncbi:MAG TPA: lipid biosynthesis B12-binding/radical SAM protein [Opitutaceae bacterium]
MRVLLVNLNTYDQPYPVYPLGLAYLDGALRQAGHQTHVWDRRARAESLEESIAHFAPDLVALSMRNVDNVQSHNQHSFVQDTVESCRRVRSATTAPLVLGGSAFSVFPRELFDLTGVDYAIQGEGERPLLRLVAALQSGAPPKDIPGLYYRDTDGAAGSLPTHPGDAVFTAEPHHEAALLQAYIKQGSLPGIQTQRGCPLRCCYCTYPLIEGRRSRYRTGEQVVEEMRRMLALGVRYTFIVDSVFNTHPDHVADVCEALIRADLGMEWECFLRPRNVSRELLALMQRAGLRHVEFGSDSFSDAVLARYGKSFTFDDIREASENAHALGLHYCHFIIFGGPGETHGTLEETLARARALPGGYYFTMIGMRIYPGTPLWRSLNPGARGETAADYLEQPRFYLAPEFTVDGLHARLMKVKAAHHNWVVGDPPPAFLTTINKLRSRGARGPMWEYIELLQRLEPQPGPARTVLGAV